MQTIKKKYPSKSFLFGEYAVLEGGKALIANTQPCFQVMTGFKGPGLKISVQSPSFKLLKKCKTQIHLKIKDPHKKKGGFGRSSAEFNFIYDFCIKNKRSQSEILKRLKFYKNCSKPLKVSGADLLSQIFKGLFYFQNAKRLNVKTFSWSFSDIDFAIFKTGKSFPTWSHLKNYRKPSKQKLNRLIRISNKTFKAFLFKKEDDFLKGIKNYFEELQNLNLVNCSTIKVLRKVSEDKRVLAAKGCGAMGAESFIIFCKKKDLKKIKMKFQKKFSFLASAKDLVF